MTEIKGKPGRKPGSTNKVKKLGNNSLMLNINMEKQIPNALEAYLIVSNSAIHCPVSKSICRTISLP